MVNRVLIVVSVEAEKEAVLRGIGKDNEMFNVVVAGVGVAAAATTTAITLTNQPYQLVINAGIAGGFVGRADVGSLVVANEIICADLGTETDEGFLPLDQLGLGATGVKVDEAAKETIIAAFKQANRKVAAGQILTLSKVTGTQETNDQLIKRYPDAVAEGMEGFGVATAALKCGIPVLEIRSISNAIGPRDRESWKIKEALIELEEASKIISEVL
ncbi:futalosine hydrolase [Alkalihalophilus lindianensis]|uniref:Futalosine hydrolase n=1 Tax=Alkalihalophilus lindianensis TaxID=1630542 RepID=A0ABU3XFD4_9BACI|nr:futalosine hydrolase [Alkalihalophilus lindianensis]MDV2686589.1 futalosine hydrolase [Alkalihalophilus lindianensis]